MGRPMIIQRSVEFPPNRPDNRIINQQFGQLIISTGAAAEAQIKFRIKSAQPWSSTKLTAKVDSTQLISTS